MGAKFLVRFDDICPTMDWSVWERLEPILVDLKIRPIMAVVPKNLDGKLRVCPSNREFWQFVSKWQRLGWTIAVHGFEHKYSSSDGGIISVNKYSEFAGLSESEQAKKLDNGLSILADHNISTKVWVAPAHSFDKTTIKLLKERGVNIISDGYFFRPVQWHAVSWIPQQFWRFRRMPFGTWTVCYHINRLSQHQVSLIANDLRKYADKITSIDAILSISPPRPASVIDHVFHFAWRQAVIARRVVRRF